MTEPVARPRVEEGRSHAVDCFVEDVTDRSRRLAPAARYGLHGVHRAWTRVRAAAAPTAPAASGGPGERGHAYGAGSGHHRYAAVRARICRGAGAGRRRARNLRA